MTMTLEQLEENKKRILSDLEETEQDCHKLLEYIAKARRMLKYVRTVADAEEFDKDMGDIEAQLIHIRLF